MESSGVLQVTKYLQQKADGLDVVRFPVLDFASYMLLPCLPITTLCHVSLAQLCNLAAISVDAMYLPLWDKMRVCMLNPICQKCASETQHS